VRNPAGGRPAFQRLLEDTASRPMARARFTASWRLCAPSFRYSAAGES
jgi:hypothetical protein